MPSTAHDELLTDGEVQVLLGISRTTLWRLRRSAGMPYGRVGRKCRYVRSDIIEWVRESGDATGLQLTLFTKGSHR
jgi:excisionase family DNA binding protein